MHRPFVLLLAAVVLFASHAVQAQTTDEPSASPTPSPSPTIDPATEKKAFDLLESASEQAVNLHAPSNRIRASCAIADLIWSRDEKRARALFNAALSQLATRISETDFGEMEGYQEMSRLEQLRQELVTRIATHDAELALAALRQTRLPLGNVRPNPNYSSQSLGQWNTQESNLEMSLALIIAAKNPETALKLARASLARGFSWNLIPFMTQLYQKDAKAGQALYQDIVTKLKSDNFARSPESANNAMQLLSSFQPPQADEDTFRDLLSSVIGAMLGLDRSTSNGIGMSQNFYYQIERMQSLIEKYAPARAAELRNWSQTVERTLDPQTKMYQEMQRTSQNGTVDDMLALASKYPPEFQNLLYQNAAWKALSTGDPARANEIIDMMPDPLQRRQMHDQIEAQTANAAKDGGKLAQARALVEKANSVNRKIELLVNMANDFADADDKKSALELLNDGKVLLASTPQSAAQLRAQLRLAQAYSRLDRDEAFAILQPLIIKLNELLAAAAVLDGIDFRYLRDGEWEMPGANNLGTIVNILDQTLASLGRTDFDRARKLADQIERPEVRTMIEIDLAQVTLGGKPMSNQGFNARVMSGNMITMN
ncbi:MAG TPA: hypothetical protein VNG71_10620 [Pyrinomonadaceae bacterium]|nr:hypothetical protein [Pyrinomonadaceae bacterium]